MGGGADDDSASSFFYSCSNIAKLQSWQLKIHPNSPPTATPDQLFHFSKRKRGTSLSSQKDGCRKNGLNTGFPSPLSICSC
jgi:hypothetical protein